ncbi:hypothetical protein NQZ79_g7997 [Umbelopsis isabellina]|nr:hypothetical protein NQZ79_g7997 [Umbelopsis isabellina]
MKPAAQSIQHQDNSLHIPQTKPLFYQDLSIQIQQLYTRTFSDVGSRFLHLLAAEIANITTCRSVFINQLLTFDEYKESELYRKEHNFADDDKLMLIRAFYVDPKDGRIQSHPLKTVLRLEGTPHQHVIQYSQHFIPQDLTSHYPSFKDYQSMAAISLPSTPSEDFTPSTPPASNDCIGILGVLHDQPINSQDAHHIIKLLDSVKLRAGRELERIREGERLLSMKDAAKQDAESKIKFLADMSHEIRTPMNAVIALTDLLLQEKDTLGEEQVEHLEVIQTSGHHLLTVINDILDISKLNHDPKLKLEKRKFSLRKCLKDTLNMARHQATTNLHNKVVHLIECPPDMEDSSSLKQILARVEKGSTTPPLPRVMKGKTLLPLVWKIERDVPDILIGDSMRLTQIVLNLCSNAVKFTKQGHIEVNIKRYVPSSAQSQATLPSNSGKPMYEAKIENIRSRAVRESTAQKAKQAAVTSNTNPSQEGYDPNAAETVILEISVSDTGIGIPSDRLPKLFKSFSQIDISTARRYGGTGLGLAISSTLVNHMGGGLWVESEEGLGSRFALTIPILVAPVQPDTPGNRSSDGWTPLTSPPSPCSTSSEGTSGAQSVSTERSLDFTSPAAGCLSPSQSISHAQGYFSQHSSTRSTSPVAQPAAQGNTYKQPSIPSLAWAPPPPPVSLALGAPPIAKHPYSSNQDGTSTSKPMVTRSQYANADHDSLAIPTSGAASVSPKLKSQSIDTKYSSAGSPNDSQYQQSIPSPPRITVGKPQNLTTKPLDDKQAAESSVPKASGSLLTSAATSGGQSVTHNRTSRASVAKQHHHHRRGGNVNEENVALAFPVKILLAEDNVLNQKIAISILKRLGYTGVEIANNGREVLDAMRRTRFDVIFMDLYMPEMDGLEVTKSIISARHSPDTDLHNVQDVYIIALTASASMQDRQICIEAGMNDFISKPFTMLEMKTSLKKCMYRQRKKRRKQQSPRPEAPNSGKQSDGEEGEDEDDDDDDTTASANDPMLGVEGASYQGLVRGRT